MADKNINQLDPARPGAPARDFEIPVWDVTTNRTVKRSLAAVLGIGSSDIRGGAKFVKYLSSDFYGVVATDSTLDRVDDATLVVGNLAHVYNPSTTPTTTSQMAREYVLARVGVGTPGALLAYVDDRPTTTERVPCKWVEVGTAAAALAGVEAFDPDRDEYKNSATVKYSIGPALGLFQARKILHAVDYPTGKIPPPSGLSSDPYWQPFSYSTGTSTPGPSPGAPALELTAAALASTDPAFELSPAVTALGRARLRVLVSPVTTPPAPADGFPYSFPTSLP